MPVLSLAEAKNYLKINDDNRNAEVAQIVDTAEQVIANRCGPLEPTPTTMRVRGQGCALQLTAFPALTLTSVTPLGCASLPLADLYLDGPTGLVTYNAGGVFGSPFYDVVYEAGRVSVPADLLNGIEELVRHLWSAAQRPAHALTAPVSPATYLLPYVVRDLIEPYTQSGFA